MTEQNSDIAAVFLRERSRLGNFILREVADPSAAEDILQDVFHEFVQAWRLTTTIEQAGAWLFRVARNRIVDRFRKKKELPLEQDGEDADDTLRLDLALPSQEAGPEAQYTRSVLLQALQQALEELSTPQREVFLAHELEGRSFKEMAADSGLPVNTLLARKRQAVLHLRARLQSVYDELEN
ncbi:sigma-70 family RNA polymerase sigma factor [Xylophilus rhododendri]|uniref:Sigma-70 family RNA polymerase sigma factor n=1 Tax=Xylophilus rhododendri TaxID=2697032 RepID=A0A857J4B5_9BURK|nr:sigma-70 family RNA polymerase sigma factor [Xylophilus rhododendri]QHI97708.1 sigma-70 family RNA polymerase sigma factor [Xylophilus rhododendri]